MNNLKPILFAHIIIPLAVFALQGAAPASACIPDDSNVSCIDPRFLRLSHDPGSLISSVTLLAAPTPRGESLTTARDITDTWSTIDPRASIWFKTDDSPGYREIEVWVDTPVQNAFGLSIFSPDQADSWWHSKPVGRGSYNPGIPAHALMWKAAYAELGVWYALLQNYADSPVPYKLTGNITSTATKSCHGYWEPLINGAYIYWIDCNPPHNPQ